MIVSRQRLLLGVPLLAALLVAAAGWWSHRLVRRTLEAKLSDELQTVLKANVAALEIWLNTQTRLAGVLAGDPAIRELTLETVQSPPPDTVSIRKPPSEPSAAANLQKELDARIQSSGYGVALVLNTNLQIVAASSRGRNRLWERIEDEHAVRVEEAFTAGRPVLITPFKAGFGRRGRREFPPRPGMEPGRPPRGSAPEGFRESFPGRSPNGRPMDPPGRGGPPGGPDLNLMELVTPVLDDSGRVAAAIAFVLRPEEEFTRVLSVARPGESGETFAFDPSGRLISGSRFDEQLRQLGLLTNAPGASSSLNIELRDPGADLTLGLAPVNGESSARPLTTMVASAVSGKSGITVTPERDYRGVPVVGAWRWLPDYGFGVVTKTDAAEAFRPLRVLRSLVFGLLALLAAASLGTLVSGYGNLVWRRRFDEARLRARQLGQYTLLEKIGEGAMGKVYRARHALLRRETAVKLLLPDSADPEMIRHFEHEVQLTCRLSHPNTIQIYDYGRTDDGIFYYAMELLRGMTLLDLVERHGPQPEERVLHLLVQVCESLHEAHQVGLIHRDIKTGNLFLCERGGVPDTVKVLDFGLVRRFGEAAGAQDGADDEPSRYLGTPLYMAPETIRRPGFGDPRTDVYALGAVGYELLTGQPLFEGRNPEAIWQQQQFSEPIPLGKRSDNPVSDSLEALILRCLAKNPEARPQDMDTLGTALRACPKFRDWTPERQRTWWQHYGVPEEGRPHSQPSVGEATLKIDLRQREGPGSAT
ncbi:MAG: serine/threonine protein kinase [Verrucomicrobiae bacterium]|nr:serine/threonine protein kinase [Verrucomicrobiae bacterium]